MKVDVNEEARLMRAHAQPSQGGQVTEAHKPGVNPFEESERLAKSARNFGQGQHGAHKTATAPDQLNETKQVVNAEALRRERERNIKP